jgi:hypothetical protein
VVCLDGAFGIQRLPDSCFDGLTHFETLTHSPFLRSIGDRAFFGCRIFEPEMLLNDPVHSIESLGVAAFEGTALERLAVTRPGAWTVTSIPRRCFAALVVLESVDLRGATRLTELGEECFAESNVDTVQLPASLEAIGDGCFRGARWLASVDVSCCTALRVVGRGAFEGCEELSNLDLGVCMQLESVGLYVTNNCRKLRELRVPQSVLDRGDVIHLGHGPAYVSSDVVVGV